MFAALVALCLTASDGGTPDEILLEVRDAWQGKPPTRAQYLDFQKKLRGCVEIDPKNAECWKMLGTVYAKTGDEKKGAEAYKKFLQLTADKANENPMGDWDEW